ncbi:hypothetical protein MPTK1_1g15450 [Marchantia polymorpha subsp. ruderalis]|uniref:Ornithine cyclodeaminase n=2 Tax=Marchantia polymorpha TaxID=3197 RepID=A0AAF6AQG8_MARPO|nr:hypothetical protein MARPO_0033s0116 [Marchantia polymorpha]BBM98688.1 hypothetical protein Mp_1g15450 [Marchantia polymorpha subsp. ruderalis]|eukprot:PTQ41720.1 hypothetical protein MARPO_0033s0116 [Marchantia polymorpha]
MEGGLVIEKEQIRSILSYSALVDKLQEAFGNARSYTMPERHHHDIHARAGGRLLIMPAWSADWGPKAYIGTKLVTVFPKNANQGLASVLGVYVLASGDTGRPLALMNGTELTLWRTACVSALAARYLARAEPRLMVMVGAGALAPHLIQAHIAVHPSIDTIIVWNRTHDRATELVEALRRLPLFSESFRSVHTRKDLEDIVRAADLVVCATMADEALVRGRWLKAGVHVSLVGSFKPSMRECDDDAVTRSRVFVDADAAVCDAGELSGPIARGVVSKAHVVGDLAALVRSDVDGRRSPDDVTLFKSVGCALEDLAAAQLIYETAVSSPPPCSPSPFPSSTFVPRSARSDQPTPPTPTPNEIQCPPEES